MFTRIAVAAVLLACVACGDNMNPVAPSSELTTLEEALQDQMRKIRDAVKAKGGEND